MITKEVGKIFFFSFFFSASMKKNLCGYLPIISYTTTTTTATATQARVGATFVTAATFLLLLSFSLYPFCRHAVSLTFQSFWHPEQ
jgi:hypothetical protein